MQLQARHDQFGPVPLNAARWRTPAHHNWNKSIALAAPRAIRCTHRSVYIGNNSATAELRP